MRYEKPECGECMDCTFEEYCPGDCEVCLDYIHNPSHSPANATECKYDCVHMADVYACKYSCRYTSEIIYALKRCKDLWDVDELKVLSFGCGPCTDLFAIDYLHLQDELKYGRLEYRGGGMMIENAIKYVKQIFADDCSGHDYHHTMRVYRLAVQIAKKERADLLIVQLAALLHDVDDAKLSPGTYATKKNAVDFMESNGVYNEIIEAVCKIIEEVSFAGTDSVVPSTIEGKCVQDADRLDAMGAIGIARAFAYGGSKGRKIYDPEIKPLVNMSKEEYRQNQNSTSINHFYEKLLLLKDMMNTDAAKRIAEHRQAIMEAYLEEFMLEWEGEW